MELPLNEHHSYFISLPPTNYHRVNASLHRLNFTGPGSLSLPSGGGWGRYKEKMVHFQFASSSPDFPDTSNFIYSRQFGVSCPEFFLAEALGEWSPLSL